MTETGQALQFAHEALRAKANIVRAAILEDGMAFRYALGEPAKDYDLAKLAVENRPAVVDYLPGHWNQETVFLIQPQACGIKGGGGFET